LNKKLEKKLWDDEISIIDELVMRSRYVKFNLKKIEGLEIFDENKMRNSIQPLFAQLEELDSLDENTANSCKKYIIINLVTIIEDSFKGILKKQIDVYNGNVESLFPAPYISIPISVFDSIKKDGFTKGAIIASNFNLQNPTVIDQTMSKVLNLNFFETIQEICSRKPDKEILIHDPYAVDADVSAFAESRNQLADTWTNFFELFDFRNRIIHSLSDIEIDKQEINCWITDTFWFIQIAEALSFAVGVINNKSFEELEKLEYFFGMKSSNIQSLILGKRDSYSQTTFKK